jgi:hypothetical protein
MSCEFFGIHDFSIKFSEIQNLNGSKFSKSKNVQYIVCPTFSESLKTFFDNMIHQKANFLQVFRFFEQDLMILTFIIY